MAFSFNQGDRPLAGYTIQRAVGRGGFGEVYYAVSDGGKEVALKYLRDNPSVELRGVSHCLNLKSPHLVDTFDVRQNDAGEWFVIMEYVAGPTLRDILQEEPTGLGVEKAAFFLREIARGLAYLHDRGIVHRDLKPANVFFDEGYVKIGDYGLSKFMAASQHSGQTMSVGTVHYMAPEIGSGNYDRTIDIYALGVMLYEMLLGRAPFVGSSVGEILMKHLTAQPALDALPQPFPEVIRKALAKDPHDRYQTVHEMVSAVFASADLDRSVALLEPGSVTLAAQRAAKVAKVMVGVKAGGSSNVGLPSPGSAAAAPPIIDPRRSGPPTPPPPVPAQRSRKKAVKDQVDEFWNGFGETKAGAPTFPPRTRWKAGLLGLFLGPLGVHRFYLGYNAIGVWQILLTCFTGIGALWGIVEGIMILANGNMVDEYGRPLVAGDAGKRSLIVRSFWGLMGGLFMLGSLGTLVAGTVAPAEMDDRYTLSGELIGINLMRLFYLISCAQLGIGSFCLWKASHRRGYSFWRATMRPLLMCVSTTMATASLAAFLTLAHGGEHTLLIVTGLAATAAFCTLWLLRGPEGAVLPTDAYWDKAFRRVFLALAIALPASLGLARPLARAQDTISATVGRLQATYEAERLEARRELDRYYARQNKDFRSDNEFGEARAALPERDGPHSPKPLLLPMILMLSATCFLEAGYRKRRCQLANSQ